MNNICFSRLSSFSRQSTHTNDAAVPAVPSLGTLDILSKELQLLVLPHVADRVGSLRSFYGTCRAARELTSRFVEHAVKAEAFESERLSIHRPRVPILNDHILDECSLLVKSRVRRAPTVRETLKNWSEKEQKRNAEGFSAVELIADTYANRNSLLDLSNLRLSTWPKKLILPMVETLRLQGNLFEKIDLRLLTRLQRLDVGSNSVMVTAVFNGARFDVEWQGSEPHGHGTCVNARGERYEGQWQDGKPHGKGTGVYANGERCEGEWQNGELHGKGICVYASGARYEGEWQRGNPHGKGVKVEASGARYEGEWQDGERHGEGVKVEANGARYEGEWQNGKPHGKGVEVEADGARYEGEWRDGERHGEGVKVETNGARYEGEWQNGKFYDHRPLLQRLLNWP